VNIYIQGVSSALVERVCSPPPASCPKTSSNRLNIPLSLELSGMVGKVFTTADEWQLGPSACTNMMTHGCRTEACKVTLGKIRALANYKWRVNSRSHRIRADENSVARHQLRSIAFALPRDRAGDSEGVRLGSFLRCSASVADVSQSPISLG
jgi:hypothetical protein